ncbi:hypothetical protein IPN41_00340 [Candidatus Falkowbacteria bacterium]|nr:MAG: hypothetical protein IPN41_00340 [Candidatus Falkowbacteria bacterium]
MGKQLLKMLASIGVISLMLPIVALAQGNTIDPPVEGSDPFGFGQKLDDIAAPYSPTTTVPLEQRVGEIISIFLGFLGVIFLILMIYAGFNWMTAGGEEEQITKARNTIRAAIIGLLIVISAYALSVFIIERLWGTVV